MSSILQIRDDTLEDTMMDFLKVIYENVEKQNSFHSKHIYIHWSHTFC